MTTISSIRKTAYAFLISAMLGAGVFTGSASAAENTKALTPQQTLEMVNKDNKVLFVDVRDPVEIMFIGHANAAHINIPFMFADKVYLSPSAHRQFGNYAYDKLRARW